MRGCLFLLCISFQLLAAEGSLSFEQALTAIVEQSPVVASQRAIQEAASARSLPSRLALLPSLSAEASTTRSTDSAQSGRGLNATAQLNLFRFGADYADMRAASAEVAREGLRTEDAILKAEAEGVRVLVAFIQSRRELEILKQMVKVREESVRIAQERYRRGLMASQESDKVVVDRDNERARLKDSEASAARATADLAAALGSHAVLAEWPWKESLNSRRDILEKETSSLSQRPDWRAEEKKVEAARLRKRQAWGKMFPSVDANIKYGYFQQQNADQGGSQWSGGVVLSIPLFDRLTNFSAYKGLVHDESSAQANLEKIRREAKSEWESAKASFQFSLDSATVRESTLAISRKLFQDNFSRFQRGLVSADDLLIDYRRLYDSESLTIAGWATAHTQFTKLCHSIGMRVSKCLQVR
ncbi:MAG: TolC family protein [Deltaproteobacteria bacterium]|nr:TolC family protein [Deltaproteobacteria bacterium]